VQRKLFRKSFFGQPAAECSSLWVLVDDNDHRDCNPFAVPNHWSRWNKSQTSLLQLEDRVRFLSLMQVQW
jgi:hypothetical protein